MKSMKRILVGLALSAALMLGMAVPAIAADAPVINKTVQSNSGSGTFQGTFQFEIEAIELNTNINGVKTYMDAPQPTIQDINMWGGGAGSTSVTFGTWPHAGIFAWKVTEKTGTYTGEGEMQYDPQIYTIIADVRNSTQGSGLEANYIIVKGLATSTEELGDNKVASMNFTNKFTKYTSNNNDLVIKKTVTGGGDTAKQFEFTVVFTAPTVLPAGKTAADVLNEITADTTRGATVIYDDPVDPGATTREFRYTAADGQEIVFKNILLGSTYTITEAFDSSYMQMWHYDTWETSMYNNDDILINNDLNSGEMVNTYLVTPPTAVISNNLPFILLGVLAFGGLVIYFAVKKKLTR